jgi:DNA-binding transcriptional regulator GbsR (MarR family)
MEYKELELNEENLKFIEKLGIYYENYGVPRIGGKILGFIVIANRPVSAEQIYNLLKVSRGSISTNVRLLVTYGLIERTSIAGDRTDYYVVSDSAWDSAIKVRIEGFKTLKGIVEQGTKSLDKESTANKNLHEMMQWADIMIDSHEKALKEWRKD